MLYFIKILLNLIFENELNNIKEMMLLTENYW